MSGYHQRRSGDAIMRRRIEVITLRGADRTMRASWPDHRLALKGGGDGGNEG